ncbi:MAG: hypothetical protein J4G14_10215 [Dehalococcoidia bacterium]|nr:hypothetical protein [Dehalococcoidia bacterium]
MNARSPATDTTTSGMLTSPTGMTFTSTRHDRPYMSLNQSSDEGAFSYVRPGSASFTGGQDHRPEVWDVIADYLALIGDRSGRTSVSTARGSLVRSTTIHVKSAHRPPWRPQIVDAATREEIIAVLRLFGLDVVADRLVYLCSLADDDPDEPRIEIESLRAMALFIMSERNLLDPRIGVTPDGLIQIEWRVPDNGVLAMVFLTSGLIRFAAISGPHQPETDRWSVNGTLPREGTLSAVEPFTVGIRLI